VLKKNTKFFLRLRLQNFNFFWRMKISIDLIKELRAKTGISIKECKKALEESKGSLGKAIDILKKRGERIKKQKAGRETKSGVIGVYVHVNKQQAALVKLVCETDFVAKNEEFRQLAHSLAMQVVAMNPVWISSSDVPEKIIKEKKESYSREIDKSKPKEIKEKIIQGKLAKFYQESCLLSQLFIKNDKITIAQLIAEYINKLGEKIEIKEFVKFKI